MSRPLPGAHYCLAHQGNHSHYDPDNCYVCQLCKTLRDALDTIDACGSINVDKARALLARVEAKGV